MSGAASRPERLTVQADLDLRLVRYFTVVAEHLNFGRAAAALHVAQPALSRQVRRLESQLGARLLIARRRAAASPKPVTPSFPRPTSCSASPTERR